MKLHLPFALTLALQSCAAPPLDEVSVCVPARDPAAVQEAAAEAAAIWSYALGIEIRTDLPGRCDVVVRTREPGPGCRAEATACAPRSEVQLNSERFLAWAEHDSEQAAVIVAHELGHVFADSDAHESSGMMARVLKPKDPFNRCVSRETIEDVRRAGRVVVKETQACLEKNQ